MNPDSTLAIFLFYNKATGKQAFLSFNETIKHVNVIVYDGTQPVLIDMDKTGIKTRVLRITDVNKILSNIKRIPILTSIIVAYIDKRAASAWRPWWVRSCNEIARHATGINVGFTFNPIHLYNKLLQCDGTDYDILTHWRRDNGHVRG